MEAETAIQVQDLWFSYPNQLVLSDVSLSVDRGELVSVVGPNGGGKTTLLKLLLGLLRPDRGEIRILGIPPLKARSFVGYTPQHARFDAEFPVSVLEVVRMGSLGRGGLFSGFGSPARKVALDALGRVGLADLARRPFSDLSGGQRQRVLIARAITSDPKILLLDEPTANLDVGAESEFYSLLESLSGLTVLMVSHDVGFVSKSVDKVVCVNRSAQVHPTADLTGEMIQDLYRQDLRLVRHDHDCLHARPEEVEHE